MLRKLSTILLYMPFLLCSSAFTAAAPQNTADRFELRGKAINAATGEPVSGALVELPGQYS